MPLEVPNMHVMLVLCIVDVVCRLVNRDTAREDFKCRSLVAFVDLVSRAITI